MTGGRAQRKRQWVLQGMADLTRISLRRFLGRWYTSLGWASPEIHESKLECRNKTHRTDMWYIYMCVCVCVCVKNSDAIGADHTRWFWIMTSLAISRVFCSLVNHDYDYDKPDMWFSCISTLRVDSLCDGIRFGLKSSRWSSAKQISRFIPSTGADFGVEEGVRHHKSTPQKGSWGRKIPLFQGNL